MGTYLHLFDEEQNYTDYVNSAQYREPYGVGIKTTYKAHYNKYNYNGKYHKYITDGLVFHLDGTDCTGTQWQDRISGKILSLSGSAPSVSNGGVVFNGASVFYNTTIIPPAYNVGTIEVVLNNRVTESTGKWIVGHGTADGICFTINTAYHETSFRLSTSNYPRRLGLTENNKIYTHSITTTYNIVNKQSKNSASNDYWGLGYCFSVGGKITNNSFARDKMCKSTVYQIRIYNRKLTYNEIINNQTVDIEKYNISI